MSTTKEKSEAEYMRARMGDLYVGDDSPPPPPPSTNPAASTPPAPTSKPSNIPQQTDTISAEEARKAKDSGNERYKAADYPAALELYTRAASSLHSTDDERAIALANRAAVYLKLEKFAETVEDACMAVQLKPGYVKAVMRRKEARVRLGEFRKAVDDAKELGDAAEVARLTKLAEEREKKDTEEAMNGLKDLGNSILSNFGMSLNDFSFEKDPNTGNYSISTKR